MKYISYYLNIFIKNIFLHYTGYDGITRINITALQLIFTSTHTEPMRAAVLDSTHSMCQLEIQDEVQF